MGEGSVGQVSFIVSSLSENHRKDKEILVLAKAIKFNFSNEELSQEVCSLVESVVHNHGEGRKVASWLVER